MKNVRVLVDESGGVINFIVNDDEEILKTHTALVCLLAALPPALLVSPHPPPPVKEINNPGRMPKAAGQSFLRPWGGCLSHTFFELCSATSENVISCVSDMAAVDSGGAGPRGERDSGWETKRMGVRIWRNRNQIGLIEGVSGN